MGSELQMAGGVASVGSTVLALSAATGPAAPFVAAGGAVLSLLGSLFSRPDKFLQNAYPVMLRQAQSSGYNVYAFWFGDMMEVTPSGQHGTAIVGSGRPQPELLDEIAQSQGNTPWYSARCTRADDDCVNNPSGIVFDLHQGSGLSISSLAGSGSNMLPLLLAGGFVAFMVWGRS